ERLASGLSSAWPPAIPARLDPGPVGGGGNAAGHPIRAWPSLRLQSPAPAGLEWRKLGHRQPCGPPASLWPGHCRAVSAFAVHHCVQKDCCPVALRHSFPTARA
ncbi:hypothetical protein HDU91_003116, partial [Kappamyces sp. JEL0680]